MDAIRHHRRQAGLTQQELARALDVDRLTVWRWENDKTSIPWDQLLKVAQFFKVAPVEIDPSLHVLLEPTSQH